MDDSFYECTGNTLGTGTCNRSASSPQDKQDSLIAAQNGPVKQEAEQIYNRKGPRQDITLRNIVSQYCISSNQFNFPQLHHFPTVYSLLESSDKSLFINPLKIKTK